MGSIEGVIILSSTNEPILNSHFVHPLANYPSLHADRLVEKLEASSSEKEKVGNSSKDVLPVVFVDDIPSLQEEEAESQDEEEEKEPDSEWQASNGKNTRHGAGLVHIEHNRLRFIATFSKQVDPLLPLTFLHSLLANLELYLGSPLTEESIRENFDVVYQMLEEMLDESGHPLNTEYNTLRELVREPSWIDGIVSKLGSAVSNISNTALGNAMSQPHISPIPWRRPITNAQRSGTRNEIYIDVVEVISGIFSRSSHPKAIGPLGLHCRLEGYSKLSGTPDLRLRLTDSRRILDASLHPCVRIRPWKQDKILSFIPPDGKFCLADFELESVSALERHVPIQLQCSRGKAGDHSTFTITVSASKTIEDVEILFRIDEGNCTIESTLTGGSRPGVASEDLNALKGSFHFNAKTGMARWQIGTLSNDQRALQLQGTIKSETIPGLSNAVTSKFSVPQTSLSGLKVANLEVINDVGYKPFKGVKSLLRGEIEWRW
ncbi:clathrin adaptor, mu subunit [Meira miltonrushii]|uniref:Clathrin adaptor, mu subunit n=1 Tax=Meira miltonrushii TaxID=1280837 RepID=A0A316VHC4_9BASI|nr:clathrin adaptor, mu subunit [Meira miltonrushii]PWN35391.1 clathrin adaptor, mu subunit [Meira miltonrushii]